MSSNTLTAPVAGQQQPLELRAHLAGREATCPRVAAGRRRGIALTCGAMLGVAAAAVFVHWVFIDHALFRPHPIFRPGVESVVPESESAQDQVLWTCAMDWGAWQPLGRLSLIAELWTVGARHDDFILTNIALHAVVASLLFLVILRVARNALLAACAAGAFAVHPAAVPAVASIGGRTELLAAVFGLLATLWYVDFRRHGRKRSIAASVFCSTASALASPALIALPLLLPLMHTATLRKRASAAGLSRQAPFDRRRLDWRFWSFVAAMLVVAVAAIAEFTDALSYPAAAETLRHRAILLASSIATQLGRVIAPHWTAGEWPHGGRWILWVTLGAVTVLIATCLGSAMLFRRIPMICAGWLWFIGAAIPAAGIAVLNGKDGQHACAYVPLIGSVTAAVFLVWAVANVRGVRAIAIPLIAVANVAILARMSLVDAPSRLERWGGLVSDAGVATMREASGRSYVEHRRRTQTDWLDAMLSIDMAVDAPKDTANVQCRTGTALENLGDTALAVLYYQRAINLDPNCFAAQFNLGRIELENERWSEAEQHFWRALEIVPTQGRPYIAIARIYEQRGATFESLEYLKRALELEPALRDFDPGIAAIYPGENVTGVVERLQQSLKRSQEGSEAGLELAKILGRNEQKKGRSGLRPL